MASTTALLTGLSGMTANARRLDVIGNNIANVNTTAFKANRILFSPTFSRTLSSGSGPSGASGGTNPAQIGLGISISGTQRNFNGGGISATGQATDLAIEGNGFFIVKKGDQSFYTRNGSFQLNATRELVTANGERVQGYAIDDNFNILEGDLVGLTIPVGSLTIAGSTQNVSFAGNLHAGGVVPTTGSVIDFDQPFFDLTSNPILTPGTTTLNQLEDPNNPTVPLFPTGSPYTFTLTDVQKGGKTLPDATFTFDSAVNTLQDLIDFVDRTLGIAPGLPNANPPPATTGVFYDTATGFLSIAGNTGSANAIIFGANNIVLTDTAGVTMVNPFTATTAFTADGESVRTTFIVYDSLGAEVEVDLTMVLDSTSSAGTTWRYHVESEDNVVLGPPPAGRFISTGLLTFDNFGRLTTTTPVSVNIGREGTGAETPLSIDFAFNSPGNKVTALNNGNSSQPSTMAAVFQDGTPIGTLVTFTVSADGLISGGFSNGLSRSIGRVAIATFSKPEGLFDSGNDLFSVGPNSGTPLITTPGQFGAGKMIGGALEQSNVDLGQEFIELVLTSTGYSASSRVISTADQLLQQLIALTR